MTASVTATISRKQAARALLRWWHAAGVDALVDAEPGSWLAAPEPAAAPAFPPADAGAEQQPSRQPVVQQPAVQVAPEQNSEAAAAAAQTLDALHDAIRAFDGCGLKARATSTVICDGPADAPVMLIGEAPGGDEDRVGRPFVGAAGQLLDKMLAAIGLSRHADTPKAGIYITNSVFWRPPGNRQPTPQEVAQCLPFVRRHIALVRPRLIVLAGAISAQSLLETREGITRLRGQWHSLTIEGTAYPALPMLHPAYLLRQPAQKGLAWSDLLALRLRLDQLLA